MALHTITRLTRSSLRLVPNYDVLNSPNIVLVPGNEGGGSSSYARPCKETSGFDFEYSSIIQWILQMLSLSLSL